LLYIACLLEGKNNNNSNSNSNSNNNNKKKNQTMAYSTTTTLGDLGNRRRDEMKIAKESWASGSKGPSERITMQEAEAKENDM